METRSASRILQHALDARDRDLRRHDLLDQVGLLLRQVLDELVDLRIGEDFGDVGLDQLGQMGREHGRRVDDGVALDGGFLLERGIDPGRRQAEGRLGGVDAGHRHLAAAGIHDHVLARPDAAGAGVHLLDLDRVGVGVELHVVEDAHRRHHEAHLDRERAPQRLDLLGQPVGAVGRIDQRQQRVAQLDLEIVDLERGRDRLLGRRGLGDVGLGLVSAATCLLLPLVDHDRPARRRRRRAA